MQNVSQGQAGGSIAGANHPFIPPVVGRVVHYHPAPHSAESTFAHYSDNQPHAAQIAYVWGPSMVNLSVLDHAGVAHSRTSVRLIQAGETPPPGQAYCEWMPYQKGQAAKTEQLEKSALELGAEARSLGNTTY